MRRMPKMKILNQIKLLKRWKTRRGPSIKKRWGRELETLNSSLSTENELIKEQREGESEKGKEQKFKIW